MGAGIAAAATAVYFLTGEKGKKNREAIKGWMSKAKKEVVAKLEKAKNLTQDSYDAMIEEVVSKYESAKEVTPKEIKELKGELKSHWKKIAKSMEAKAA